MGRSDKNQIRSRLRVLVAHLLKWKYQPGARTPGWRRTIRDQREEIMDVVTTSPSLKKFPAAIAVDVYSSARNRASEETGIDYTLFPDECPFTAEQILDPDFMRLSQDCYVPNRTDSERRAPEISPTYADLRNLPPCLVSVGTCDHLLDDSLIFASRAVAAGVSVDLHVLPEMPHGFQMFDVNHGNL